MRDAFHAFQSTSRFISLDPDTVESEGPYAPEEIFPASIRVMRKKIAGLKKATEQLMGMTEDAEPQQNTPEDVVMADT